MAKQLHYLLIAEGLTGDSDVYFYATPELAEQAFKNLIKPLVDACMNNHYDTEEQDVFYHLKEGKAVRFNSGELDALDEYLSECNRYVEWGTATVKDDVTHYIAEFSEWVDESTITFYNTEQAKIKYNDGIDEGISIAKEHHTIEINRHDQSTWTHEGNTVFSEPIDTSVNHSDAFFGYNQDTYYTIRCGEIDVMDKKEYTVIASGGYLKRPDISTLTIDPTDPDILRMLGGFKTYDELIDYILEEEDAEWGQHFCKCNIINKETMSDIIKQDEEEQDEEQDDLRSAKPNTFIFSSVPKQIFVALDPTPFDVSDFGTGKSIILGVFTSLDKANETVLDALKQLEDYDEDEMTPDQYIETHILL